MKKLFTLIALAISAMTINATEVVLWEGESVIKNWEVAEGSTRASAPASAFVDANVGDKLIIHYQIEANAWVEFWAADMSKDLKSIPGGTFYASETSHTVVITSEVLAQLQTYGVTLSSENLITITAIILDMSADPNAPMTLWEGNLVCTKGWDLDYSITIPASALTDVKEGDIIMLDLKDVNPDACIALKTPNGWADIPADEAWGNYLYPAADATSATFNVNADCANTLKTNGLLIMGGNNNGFTITKVMLKTKSGQNTNGIDNVNVTGNNNGVVYNFAGMKVAESLDAVTTPGLYICNGHKIVIK